METKATLKYLRIAPRKVRRLVDLLRGKSFAEAERELLSSSQRAAKPLLKLLQSAKANLGQNRDNQGLSIKEIRVDGGATLKRWMPRAMGRASSIAKRTSHVSLVLVSKEDLKLSQSPEIKVAEAQEVKAEPRIKEGRGSFREESGLKIAPRKQISGRRFFRRKAV